MDWTTILQRRTTDPRFESVVAWVERGDPADLEAVLATPAPLLPSSCVERLVDVLPVDRVYETEQQRRAAELFLLGAEWIGIVADWVAETLGRPDPVATLTPSLPAALRTRALVRALRYFDLTVEGRFAPTGAFLATLGAERFELLARAVAFTEAPGTFGAMAWPGHAARRMQDVARWILLQPDAEELSGAVAGHDAMTSALACAGAQWAVGRALGVASARADPRQRCMALEALESSAPGSTGGAFAEAALGLAADSSSATYGLVALARLEGSAALPRIVGALDRVPESARSMAVGGVVRTLGPAAVPLLDCLHGAALASSVAHLVRGGMRVTDRGLRPQVERMLGSHDVGSVPRLFEVLTPADGPALVAHAQRFLGVRPIHVRAAASVLFGAADPADPAAFLAAVAPGRAEGLASLLEPCAGFTLAPGEASTVGASRLGGAPDVPEDFRWPGARGRPLDFLMQVALAELRGHRVAEALPTDGVLAFFYDLERKPSGHDPAALDGFRLYWFDASTPLAPREPPKRRTRLAPHALRWFDAWTLPLDGTANLSRYATAEVVKCVDAWFRAPFCPKPRTMHHLLGHANALQKPMQLEAHVVTEGRGQSVEEPVGSADDWILLLQLDTDDQAGLSWRDAGRLYWWIRRQDLAARRFDRVWVGLQCH